jgi:UDP-N-acetylglucosamine 2-epimerase (non-hydrolysing)
VRGRGLKIVHVVGARPNFIKIGPLIESFRNRSELELSGGRRPIEQFLVHTGQHYDRNMSALFFNDLGIPAPDANLGVGSGSHAAQTAEIMKRFESICTEQKPTHVLVVGDVNSTIACALVAVKLGILVVHVEAGLRSFDRRMPEEINRILTDAISDYLFTTEESANENLLKEGIPKEKIHFVGNVMIDTLMKHRKTAEASKVLENLGLASGGGGVLPYGVLTLHRPGTVEDSGTLTEILQAIACIATEMPMVFPVHPRTKAKIESFGLKDLLYWNDRPALNGSVASKGILAIEPLGYLDFLRLISKAKVVLTDSGGIQEETTILRTPCVTLRESTERPATISHGTNILAGIKKAEIVTKTHGQLERFAKVGPDLLRQEGRLSPPLWDGKAAERIVEVLLANQGDQASTHGRSEGLL